MYGIAGVARSALDITITFRNAHNYAALHQPVAIGILSNLARVNRILQRSRQRDRAAKQDHSPDLVGARAIRDPN